MSDGGPERSWIEPPAESIGLEPGKVRDCRPRDLLVRFAFGATTSIVAGAVTLATNARVGGMFLAFPAILAASLTLIDEEDGSADAREDARGAVVGAVALAGFAGVCALLFGDALPVGVLVAATAAWVTLAVGLYVLLWQRRRDPRGCRSASREPLPSARRRPRRAPAGD